MPAITVNCLSAFRERRTAFACPPERIERQPRDAFRMARGEQRRAPEEMPYTRNWAMPRVFEM